MNLHKVVAASLILGISATAWASPEVYVDTQAWAYAEPLAALDYAKDWKGPLGTGSDGYALLQAESGVRYANWRVGWLWQRQYAIDATRDTALLYYAQKNRLSLPTNRQFSVDLNATFYEANGLRVGRQFAELPLGSMRLDIEPSVVAWQASRFEDGSLTGTGVTDASGQLAYDAVLAHDYNKDRLLGRRVDRTHGYGASLDLAARLSINEQWDIDVDARNLFGDLWWQDAPYTVGHLASDTQQTDSQGLVHFAPTLTGYEGNHQHVQRMPLFAKLESIWRREQFRFFSGVTRTRIGLFPDVGLGRDIGPVAVDLRALPTAGKALQLDLHWKWIGLRYGASALQPDAAHQLQFGLTVNIPL